MEPNYYYLNDTQFDKEFDKTALLERYPWVGCDFAKSTNRPLIIGDSHYATDDDGKFSQEEYDNFKSNKNSTRGIINCVIRDVCKGDPTWSMFRNLVSTFTNLTPDEVKHLWSKVAFYNFIQEPMRHKDEKPSIQYVADGWRCLAGVIEVLHPTSILIIGVRNDCCSDKINGEEIRLEEFMDDIDYKINGCTPRIGKIIFKNEIIPITLIKHTSQGYNCDLWHEYLEKRDPKMMGYLSR